MRYVEATAPSVIDEELCRACIHLLQPKELTPSGTIETEVNRQSTVTKQQNLPFSEVEYLVFSFKNILKINNLVGFDRLVRLYLDNNVIVKIENLDHLVNLEWLDLSFNNIERIEGLDSLVKLESLSLFNNRIEALENLDALVGSLQVLSIGNNRLADLEQTKELRKFKQLQAVTFAGNPLAAKDDYRAYVLAHLNHLRYLDYRLVDEAEVAQAETDGSLQERLQEIRAAEAQDEENLEVSRKLADRSAALHNAHLGAIDNFWGKLEAATAESTAKVSVVDQLSELHAKKRPEFESRLDDFIQLATTRLKTKQEEHALYLDAAASMRQANNAEALEHIARFNAKAKEVRRLFAAAEGKAYNAAQEQQRSDALVALREANEQLYDSLMDLEMMEVDQFRAALDAFELQYNALHNASKEAINSTFDEMRTLATAWTEEAQDYATQRHDLFVSEAQNDSDELSDELKQVLNDKEGMTNAITGEHESRIGFLDATEDTLGKDETRAYNSIIDGLREGEYRRNRERVNEISKLVHDTNKDMIEELQAALDAEDK